MLNTFAGEVKFAMLEEKRSKTTLLCDFKATKKLEGCAKSLKSPQDELSWKAGCYFRKL